MVSIPIRPLILFAMSFLHLLVFQTRGALSKHATSGSIRAMHYVSWTEHFNGLPYVSWNGSRSEHATQLSYVSRSDDQVQSLRLPFTFPFLGVERYTVYVGANGFVGFDSSSIPPCSSIINSADGSTTSVCFQSFNEIGGTPGSNFNTSYFGMIAAFTTDLFPGATYPLSTISWSGNASAGLYVHYENLPSYSFPYTSNYTFHVELNADGHASIFYENLNYNVSKGIGQPDYLINGIRDTSPSSSSVATSYLTTTTAQKALQSSWQTVVRGVYGDFGLPKAQTQLHFCPVPDAWCAKPLAFAVVTNSSTHEMPLLLRTLYSSCLDRFSHYTCVFTRVAYKVTRTANLLADGKSFNCTIPWDLAAAPGNVSVNINAYMKSKQHTSTATFSVNGAVATYVSLLSSSLTIQILAAGSSSLNTLKRQCATSSNLVVSDSSNDVYLTSCNSCSVCNENSTTNAQKAVFPSCISNSLSCNSLEDNKMCNHACFNTTNTVPYSYDNNPFHTATCCPTSSIDCSGTCGGNRVFGINPNEDDDVHRQNIICCSSNILDCSGYCGNTISPRDCMGVCNGLAVIDKCGVCSGGTSGHAGDFTGATCIASLVGLPTTILANVSYLESSTSSSSSSSSSSSLATTTGGQEHSAHGTSNITFVVRNNHNFNISIQAQILNADATQQLDPLISVSILASSFDNNGYAIIAANKSMTISLSVSLVRTFTGQTNYFQSKYIEVAYLKQGADTSSTITSYIEVQPITKGCNAILAPSVCMSSPYCIYCLSNPSLRILSQAIEADTTVAIGDRELDGQWWIAQAARALYSNISPPTTLETDEQIVGYCASGTDQSSCYLPFNLPSRDYNTLRWAASLGAVMLFVLAVLVIAKFHRL